MSFTSFFDDEKQVVPLITCTNGNYTVCEETLNWLESLGEFGVIACAGKYRTGKSFLLNRLAGAESNIGFGVGDSVQACTKGLWLYKKVFEKNEKKIVFVDTEGIDALDADDTHDVRIFTLALLLSSAFIYNSMGPIDETALQTLSLMTRVTDNVKFDSDEQVKDLSPHMPKFYWVLRDFSLKLTNKNNEQITENEYLEEALHLSYDASKNSVREAIKNSFPKRSLITLPRPSTNIDPSQRMEERLMSLSKSFVNGVDNFRNRLFDETLPMKAQDAVINGKMYSMLCKHYTDIIQSDSVPIIKDSWSLLAAVKARDLKDSLISEAAQKLSIMKPKVKETLDADMKLLKKYISDQFTKQSMKPIDEEVKEQLESQIDKLIDESRLKLEINITDFVEKSLESLESCIMDSPEQLSVILNNELARFSEEHNNENDFVKTWMLIASERALCRWIPKSLHCLSSQRDDKLQEIQSLKKEYETTIQEMKESETEALRDEKIKYSELEQISDSNKCKIKLESEDNLRLRSEIISFSIELRNMEHAQQDSTAMTSFSTIDSSSNEELIQSQDELATCRIENAELRAKLSVETNSSEKNQRLHKDTNNRLERAMATHAQLEQNWKDGIDKLRIEQKQNLDKQRQDFDVRLQQQVEETNKIKADLDKECMKSNEIQDDKRRLEDKLVHEQINHDRNATHLRESVQRYREQSESAQSRVLDIHKGMLEDLRIRDERSREQQAKVIKETSEYQQRISDITRENENNKSEINQLKRRISQYEALDNESKRLKVSEREKEILIGQLKTETGELRSSNNEMLQDRENLRRENMSMEGELALLRAEKQLTDARKNMSGES